MSGYIFATKAFIDNRKKNLLNGNISSTRPHNMANVSPLTAEISWWVWGTPANFNRFRVLASLLHWHHSVEVNQTLRGVWPSPGRVQYIYIYIYIFGDSCPLTEFCQVQSSLRDQVLHYHVLAALLRGTWAVVINQTLQHGIFTRQCGHPIWHWAVELSSYCNFYQQMSVTFMTCCCQ